MPITAMSGGNSRKSLMDSQPCAEHCALLDVEAAVPMCPRESVIEEMLGTAAAKVPFLSLQKCHILILD